MKQTNTTLKMFSTRSTKKRAQTIPLPRPCGLITRSVGILFVRNGFVLNMKAGLARSSNAGGTSEPKHHFRHQLMRRCKSPIAVRSQNRPKLLLYAKQAKSTNGSAVTFSVRYPMKYRISIRTRCIPVINVSIFAAVGAVLHFRVICCPVQIPADNFWIRKIFRFR